VTLGGGTSLIGKKLAGTALGNATQKGVGRVAYNFISEGAEEVLSDLTDPLAKYLTGVDKNVGENYNEVFKFNFSKKVIVDAQKDLGRYQGIYSMTPNLPDTQKHVGFYLNNKEDFLRAGNKLLGETSADNVLITCGAEGMVVIEKGGKYTHIPVFNKSKVFDVTGAGDTVTATYSLALAIGAEPVYAAIIGNIAAGIVVKQFGCATTSIDEILSSIPENIEVEI